MDPVQAEIVKNRCIAIPEDASPIAHRTARTAFVKRTQDFQAALARSAALAERVLAVPPGLRRKLSADARREAGAGSG